MFLGGKYLLYTAESYTILRGKVTKREINKEKVKKKRISGEAYYINKQTICIGPI